MELTEADAAALERGGLALQPLDDLGPDDPIVKTAATYATLGRMIDRDRSDPWLVGITVVRDVTLLNL
jgi:hypothetical protein